MRGTRGVACDISGQKFGRYVVLARAGKDRHGNYLWSCRCDCGAVKTVVGSSLRRGRTQSCGCFNSDQKRAYAAARRAAGETRGTGFRMFVNEYRGGAAQRGHVWALSDDQAADISQKPCDYCGSPPQRVYKGHHGYGAEWVYNGLDRVDNARGYEPDNVVPCCTPCNLMKGRLGRDEFLDQSRRIVAHQAGLNL